MVKKTVGHVIFDKFTKREQQKFLNDNWEHNIKPQFDGKQATWLIEDLPAICRTPGRGQKRCRELVFTS